MLAKGFKFGMLLQLAIGPVCLFIFNTAVNKGFWQALSGVGAVALVDALYIFIAVVGIGAFLKEKKFQQIFKYFGGIVLVLFAVGIILGVFGISIMPKLNFNVANNKAEPIFYALLLTLSNPLTILFWSGIFGAKILEEKLTQKEIVLFSIGCVFATLVFLVLISLLGRILGYYFPQYLINILNITVGIFIFYFGIKLIVKQK